MIKYLFSANCTQENVASEALTGENIANCGLISHMMLGNEARVPNIMIYQYSQ